MNVGSLVRVGSYSIPAGGMVYKEMGMITQMFASMAMVDFGSGKVKRVMVSDLQAVAAGWDKVEA